MSHVVQLSIRIKSLTALKKAAKEIGLEFVEGKQTYKYFGRWVGDYPLPKNFTTADLGKCMHVLKVPNNNQAYEIGICRAKDGSNDLVLLYDFWNGGFGLVDIIGKDAVKLVQAYSKAVIKSENRELVEEEGWTVQTKTLPNGKIQMIYDDGND